MYRLFSREGAIGRKLLGQVRKDLSDVVKVCQGELKQTNHLRTLMSALTKGVLVLRVSLWPLLTKLTGTIPDHWRRYKVNKAMAVSGWIANLARRLTQLDSVAALDNLNNVEVWLGGLFFPEAYITATRQAVAHRKKWSLETLHLRLDIERVNDPGAFIVDGAFISALESFCSLHFLPATGLALEGASWSTDKLVLNDGEAVRLNPSQIRWVQSDDQSRESLVNLPVYLNNDRSDVMFTVDLPFDNSAGSLVAMRAVCLTAGG
jgi:dynein heavy chain 1